MLFYFTDIVLLSMLSIKDMKDPQKVSGELNPIYRTKVTIPLYLCFTIFKSVTLNE